ncbi:hypothetical protein Agub_g14327 [Astrephomene gubernaculifera]|uniref:Uncharacterized protein n=1 Tax=Astrephomene gubernaculifera TaxID=47775 RepID=A0AAD3E2W7_9CHLO|nr:hypothetical protein Agub_g14327 [Astrephomene gubernaculifera]
MGRGDRNPSARRHGGPTSNAHVGDPSPRQLADDAENLQQQGERRKGLEAASKFQAAAAKYELALSAVVRQRQQLGLGLAPSPQGIAAASAAAGASRGGGRGGGAVVTLEEAVDMRAALAECHQLLGEALTQAAAAAPDPQLSAEGERQAAAAALQHLTTAASHFAACHPAAVLVTPAPPAVTATVADSAVAAPLTAAAASAAAAATAAAAALSPDVGVNAGNCLAAIGERLEEEASRVAAAAAATGPSTGDWLSLYDSALGCYRGSAVCYRSALAREEDALTLGNLGDVLVQSGTCLYAVARAVRDAPQPADVAAAITAAAAAAGPAAAAAPSPAEWCAAREAEAGGEFSGALAAYEAACALSDSEQGDDLPGLLCNWGAGLLSMAGCLQDPAARLPLLEAAASRLNHAASFDRGDPQPLCSLGDVRAAAGEAAEALATAATHGSSPSEAMMTDGDSGTTASTTPGSSAAVQHWRRVAEEHLRAALEEGYGAALRLRRDEAEALVGTGGKDR